MSHFILFFLFCTQLPCTPPDTYSRDAMTEADAIKAWRSMDSRSRLGVYKVTEISPQVTDIRKVTIGAPPSFAVEISTYQVSLPATTNP